MDMNALQCAVSEVKIGIETAIKYATYRGKTYDNGQRAKEALIRSQSLIMKIHEVVKRSVLETSIQHGLRGSIHPPLGVSSPELKVSGYIKAKKQDVVLTVDNHPHKAEVISEGALEGEEDPVGRDASEHAVVVGVRSQMSSVAKNFDTLMERAFAETLNLRLRLPKLVMGEVYLLPIVEYDDKEMVNNRVAWKSRHVPVEKFIKTFLGISGRGQEELGVSIYKYDRSCLALIDCRPAQPRVFESLDELKAEGVVSPGFSADFAKLSPVNFADDLISEYLTRHR